MKAGKPRPQFVLIRTKGGQISLSLGVAVFPVSDQELYQDWIKGGDRACPSRKIQVARFGYEAYLRSKDKIFAAAQHAITMRWARSEYLSDLIRIEYKDVQAWGTAMKQYYAISDSISILKRERERIKAEFSNNYLEEALK